MSFENMAYGPLGQAVKDIMPSSEADPIGVWAASLSLYSAAISRRVRMDTKRPVVVWTVLAGRSAIGRKGYALGTASTLLADVIGGFLHTRKRDGIASGPALVDMLADLELDTMGSNGGIDGRAMVIEEEWASVLKQQKRCPKFSTLFRTAWDGKAISNRTKKDGLQSVASPLLGFHGHITPGEWGKYVSSSEALGGSYNRLLPVLVERSKILPYNNKIIAPDTSALRRAFEWAEHGEDLRIMHFSQEAGERYDEIRAEVEDRMAEMPELLASYMERAAEQVQRVAAVLTATEMKEEISREAVDAAWAFVEYSMNSVEKLVKDAATEGAGAKPMKTPEELVRDALDRFGGAAKSSDLLRVLFGKLNAAALQDTVEGMDDVDVTTERTGGRGAPRKMYRRITPAKPNLTVVQGYAPETPPAPQTPDNPFLKLL